jgi:hypothetical protein
MLLSLFALAFLVVIPEKPALSEVEWRSAFCTCLFEVKQQNAEEPGSLAL